MKGETKFRNLNYKEIEFLMDLHENQILGINRQIRSLKFIRELVANGFIKMVIIEKRYSNRSQYLFTEKGMECLKQYNNKDAGI